MARKAKGKGTSKPTGIGIFPQDTSTCKKTSRTSLTKLKSRQQHPVGHTKKKRNQKSAKPKLKLRISRQATKRITAKKIMATAKKKPARRTGEKMSEKRESVPSPARTTSTTLTTMPNAIELLEESGSRSSRRDNTATTTSNSDTDNSDNNNTSFTQIMRAQSDNDDSSFSELGGSCANLSPCIWPPRPRRRTPVVQDAASDNSDPDDEYYVTTLVRSAGTSCSRSSSSRSSPRAQAISIVGQEFTLQSSSSNSIGNSLNENVEGALVRCSEESVDPPDIFLHTQENDIQKIEYSASAVAASSPERLNVLSPSSAKSSPFSPEEPQCPRSLRRNTGTVASGPINKRVAECIRTNAIRSVMMGKTTASSSTYSCHGDQLSEEYELGNKHIWNAEEEVVTATTESHRTRINVLVEALNAAKDACRQLDFELAGARERVQNLRAKLAEDS